ncbi:NAD-dependent epimerase/dehydratase family protein [Candidatus Micrarchaeota archaeon]|nr:NAD-dependent epimerase/dehydratase family protein [Candidatus Micrarchaeota archaeon]
MKILVTGALGFIGSNITERLVKDGHEVTALDNLHTGSEENVSSVKNKIKIIKASAGDIAKLDERFDAIIHQGVYSSSPMYKDNPHLTAKAIDEWISILEYARKNSTKIVFASSSSLYNGNNPPHKEDMPILVKDYYTEARYAMERMAKLYSDLYGVQSVGLRYFSVYGPHEKSKGKYANLITQFLWEMKAGRQPVILGDGKQTRDFVYVDDVVEANMLALNYKKHDFFNVGTGKSVTITDMVSILAKKLNSPIKPKYEPNRIKNYVQHTLADTSKAASLLGFRAKVSLEDGISRLIKSY